MKDGKCPKCNSATVYTKRNGMSIGDGVIRIYIVVREDERHRRDVNHEFADELTSN